MITLLSFQYNCTLYYWLRNYLCKLIWFYIEDFCYICRYLNYVTHFDESPLSNLRPYWSQTRGFSPHKRAHLRITHARANSRCKLINLYQINRMNNICYITESRLAFLIQMEYIHMYARNHSLESAKLYLINNLFYFIQWLFITVAYCNVSLINICRYMCLAIA